MALKRLLHEGQCRSFIPSLGHEALEDLALMIDGTPKVLHSPLIFT